MNSQFKLITFFVQVLLAYQILFLCENICSCTAVNLYPKRYLANADTLSPAISLHTGRNYNGKELFFDGTILSLPFVREFKSHRFTGKINWTMYPNVNFTGQPTCLVADQSFPVTYNSEFAVNVGSIRRGCWCNYSITVTPKPRAEVRSGSVRLWNKRNAQGNSFITDGQETRLPDPFKMNSFELVGPWKEWTAFSMSDLTGNPACLFATRKSGDDWILYTNTGTELPISSIQQGCIAESAKLNSGLFDEVYQAAGSMVLIWNSCLIIITLVIFSFVTIFQNGFIII